MVVPAGIEPAFTPWDVPLVRISLQKNGSTGWNRTSVYPLGRSAGSNFIAKKW